MAVVGMVAIAAVIGGLILAGHSGGGAVSVGRVDGEVGALLAGIPQEGNTLGRPGAPVTLQVFGDLECYDSRHWFVKYLPAIIRDLVRPGILKIQYRSFRTDTLNRPEFVAQQAAALAAGRQEKLWNFVETFYHE